METETTYLINGKSASGNDYLPAMQTLGTDDVDCVVFSLPDRPDMNVYIGDSYEGTELIKRLSIWQHKEDGSIWQWKTDIQNLESVQGYVAAYLAGDMSWTETLPWEQISLSTSETWRRILPLLVLGLIIIGIFLVVKYLLQ